MKLDETKVRRLLNTAKGQIDGITRMVDEGRDSVEIANQIMAAQAILGRANREILGTQICQAVMDESIETDEERLDQVRYILDKILR